jgi:hypothetical protein
MDDRKTPGRNADRSSWGCLVLFVLALPLLDAFGFAMSTAGPFCNVVFTLGLLGFVCGATLGVYVSVRTKRQPWWSSYRWAIYGLIGMSVPTLTAIAVVSRLR